MNNKKLNIYGFLISVGLIIIGIIFIDKENALIKKEGIYSIANVNEIRIGFKSGSTVHYEFKYKNRIYNEMTTIYENENKIDKKKFIVQFLTSDPNKNTILLDKQVPSWAIAPSEGWQRKPTINDLKQQKQIKLK
jgi:hypothetical protein